MRGQSKTSSQPSKTSINKAHSIPYLKSSKKRLGAIQSYFHYILPSIGVGFKILVGDPLFCPLDGQTKGGVVVGTTIPTASILAFAWSPVLHIFFLHTPPLIITLTLVGLFGLLHGSIITIWIFFSLFSSSLARS